MKVTQNDNKVATLVVENAATSEVQRIFDKQKAHALELRTSTAAQRIATLQKLKATVLKHNDDICAAGYADFRKSGPEVELTEIFHVISEVNHAIRHLKQWMKPKRVRTKLSVLGTQAAIRYEPKGSCLIVSPWNYPFNLAFGPLVSAIAAGNTVMLKPSEMTPHMSSLLTSLVKETFSEEEVAVFEGDHRIAQELLKLPFDHIFFTGSPTVGKIVMAAAAQHLTSVTLELGGKSPVIVDESADIEKAARNIMWGKFTNNGQTCIAPDYLYVHETVKDAFISEAAQAIRKMYGETADAQAASPDYCRIVTQRHFERLSKLRDDAVNRGAKIRAGGELKAEENYIAPTLLENVPGEADIMQEEIFGPLLPIFGFKDIEEPITHINRGPKPLALYIYGKDRRHIETILKKTSSGDSCINHNLVHFLHDNLPFGGVNNSGIGKSHGFYGFKAFSHERSVLADRFSVVHWLYPPYTPKVRRLIKLSIQYLS